MKLLRNIVLVVVALLLGAVALAWWGLRVSLPETTGEKVASALSQPVSVSFDQWQRPYVQAPDLATALYAEGWLHASHRLWQMELGRRAGGGRLAELLGADLADTDEELWRVGVPQLAAQLTDNASEDLLVLIDIYLAGVN